MRNAQDFLIQQAQRLRKKKEQPQGVQPVIQSAGKPRKISLVTKVKTALQARKVFNQAKDNNFKIMKTSWKTSLFGTGGLLVMWANVAAMLLDENPATNPDWSVVISMSIAGLGLLFARDEKVSDQDAGIRPPTSAEKK